MRGTGWMGRGGSVGVGAWGAGAVAAGAALLLWPALFNGYPLLYPDSMSYLGDGRPLARILFLQGPKGYVAMRSEIYSLGIFFFHWNVTAWPIVVLQALLTSYVLWLVVRSLNMRDQSAEKLGLRAEGCEERVPAAKAGINSAAVMPGLKSRPISDASLSAASNSGTGARISAGPPYGPRCVAIRFLALVALVSFTTGLAWYVCFVMPDILGPVLYLAIYLLVFARETLTTRERCAVAAIAAWAMSSHITHLMLAVGLCLLLTLLLVLRWPPLRARGWAIGGVAAIALLVAGAQMALHGYLYGAATLDGNRMPYLSARIVSDGPGRWYLQSHCGELHWAICARVGDLPNNDDDFLWRTAVCGRARRRRSSNRCCARRCR